MVQQLEHAGYVHCPQAAADLLAAGSAQCAGIGFPGLLLELAGFLIFLCYQHYYGNPVLTYLAYPIPILIAQDIALMLFVFHFNGNMMQTLPYMAIFVSSWFILSLQKWIINLAMNLCTVISASSKFAQLQYLWKAQGAVSALTWGLFAYTCATRIITILLTTNDLTILIRFVIMLALNIWETATVLHYRKSVTKAE